MSPLLAATAAAALAGLGLLLVVRGMVGSTTPLAALVTELHRPRTGAAPDRRHAHPGDPRGCWPAIVSP